MTVKVKEATPRHIVIGIGDTRGVIPLAELRGFISELYAAELVARAKAEREHKRGGLESAELLQAVS